MAYFIDPVVDLRYVGNRGGRPLYELLREINYGVGSKSSDDRVIVPAGFVTDGASVPRALWWLFPPIDKYAPAAFVHDKLCVDQKRSWKQAHKIFYQAMRALGVSRWKAKPMYWAVRHFGPRW